jgi:hypothetical protein
VSSSGREKLRQILFCAMQFGTFILVTPEPAPQIAAAAPLEPLLSSNFLSRVMPKHECDSLLLSLSWQVLPGSASKGNGVHGSRPPVSIGGSYNGSQRVPRTFLPAANPSADAPEQLQLPIFALSAWGISMPAPSPTQQLPPLDHLGSVPLPEQPRSNAPQPSATAIKEAESFFGSTYRPMSSMTAPPLTDTATSPGSELSRSAGSKRPSGDVAPPTKDRHIDSIPLPPSVIVQSEVLTSHPPQLQQPQPRTRRYSQWARQHDAHYLQGLVHALLCFLPAVSYFLFPFMYFL